MLALPRVATRLFGVPLMVARPKLDVILNAVGERIVQGGHMLAFDEPGDAPQPSTQGAIGIVPVVGALVGRVVGMDALSGLTTYGEIGQGIENFARSPGIAGLILEMDTPGGEVAGVTELAASIERLRAETGKPVWAVASHMALSAGYNIAASADRILVDPDGYVGSVGVVATHVDQSAADAKAGLKYTFVHAGDRKVEGNSHQPLDKDARGALQAEVDEIYAEFTESVARRRSMSVEAVRGTEAAIYRAQDAVRIGLADEVSTLRQAIADMAAALQPKPSKARASSARPNSLKGKSMDNRVQAGAGDEHPADAFDDAALQERIEAAVAARVKAHAEDVAQLTEIAASAGKFGVPFDLSAAIRGGVKPDAARKQVLDAAAAKQDAQQVVTTPAHVDAAVGNHKAINTSAIYAKRRNQNAGAN